MFTARIPPDMPPISISADISSVFNPRVCKILMSTMQVIIMQTAADEAPRIIPLVFSFFNVKKAPVNGDAAANKNTRIFCIESDIVAFIVIKARSIIRIKNNIEEIVPLKINFLTVAEFVLLLFNE